MSYPGTPSIEDLLQSQETLILDGALATELERAGQQLHDTLWSADCLRTQPSMIQAIHEGYLLAGANIITTATYQASAMGFGRAGLTLDEAQSLLRLAGTLADDARTNIQRQFPERPIFVASSIGTYGAFTADGAEYRGGFDVSTATLDDYHRPRWIEACDGPSDVLALETLPDIHEIEFLMNLLEESPSQRAWVSLSCPNGRTLADGTPLREVVQLIEQQKAVIAIGINCLVPSLVEGLLRTLRDLTTRPLIAYANSGEPWDSEQRQWESATIQPIPPYRLWRSLGCQIIGGCCRTTPEDTRKVQIALDDTSH